MTEQRMDDLTNEEHEALLLMSEHGIAAPLSPATHTVLDAYTDAPMSGQIALAAALRAAVDQLTPYSVEDMPGAAFCRNKLLAMANELEQIND
jgi:hypothetical protein